MDDTAGQKVEDDDFRQTTAAICAKYRCKHCPLSSQARTALHRHLAAGGVSPEHWHRLCPLRSAWLHRTSEAQQRIALKSLPIVIWSTDNDMRFTESRGSGLDALGLAESEAVGTTICEFHDTDSIEVPCIAAHRKALETREPAIYRQDVGPVSYHCNTEPLYGATGKVIGVFGLAVDITGMADEPPEVAA